MNRQQIVDALWPLVDRCHLGHCWIMTKNGPRRIDDPFTPVSLSEHAVGSNTYGLCPIAPGSSATRAACLDLDSHKGETPWQEMRNVADTVCMLLEEEGMAPTMFRSSGGSGIHIYLLWDAPQDAHSVREFLRSILAQCEFKAGTKGVSKQEIEVFPKQDEVPTDGYGSMFILPLSKATKSELLHGEMWEMSTPVPFSIRESRIEPNVGATVPTDLARLKSALDAIPNTGEKELDYDQWRNCIFGIHHATEGGDEGLALAHEFSARSSKYDGEFLDSRVWPYVRTDRDGATVTDRTIYRLAAQEGWTDPEILDGFDVVEESSGQASEAAERFRPIAADDFAAQGKQTAWHIKGLLPHSELIVIYGESGSGKSFLTLDMVYAIARGTAWREHKVKQANVVYIAAESASGFRNRIKAYKDYHDVVGCPNLYIIPDAPRFTEGDDIKALVRAVHSLKPGIVVVDTLSRVLAGADENSNEDMGLVVSHCSTISKVTGATVLLVHHSGKDATRGARGWSGLRAAADTEIEITRADHDRVARVSKQKDGEDGQEFGFKLNTVPVGHDEDGEVVSSCVVVPTEVVIKSRQRLGVNEQALLSALPTVLEEGAAGAQSNVLVEKVLDDMALEGDPRKESKCRQNLFRAIETLCAKGIVRKESGLVILC